MRDMSPHIFSQLRKYAEVVLNAAKRKTTGAEERAAEVPYELETLRCTIWRGNDTMADAMRDLYEGQN